MSYSVKNQFDVDVRWMEGRNDDRRLEEETIETLQIGLEWFSERGGGLDRVYYDSVRYLPQVGVKVKGLVVGTAKVALESGGRVQAFAHPDSPLPQRWLKLRRAVGEMLLEDAPSLVVSHFALHTFPVLDQLGDRPLVIHFHGPWALESRIKGSKSMATWLKKNLEQITYNRATKFIVLSEAFRKILHQEYQVPWSRIHIVPGGVEIDRFKTSLAPSEARTQLNWPQDRFIIFALRRLEKRMGLENLIAAIDRVRRQHRDVLLLIAGKGVLEATLKEQIEELGLSDHVRLLGYLPDRNLAVAYRAANLSVVPTVALEGFGLIVIESLAAGTPVLGTPIGGIPEILQPLGQDLLFESYSTQDLAQGLLEVLQGQRQLPDRETCQTYVRENYAWPAIAGQLKSVYQAALSSDI